MAAGALGVLVWVRGGSWGQLVSSREGTHVRAFRLLKREKDIPAAKALLYFGFS